MVQRVVEDSTTFLRAVEPKRTGAMEEATSHTDAVDDVVGLIEAKLGIRAIDNSAVPGLGGTTISQRFDYHPSDSSHYPIFVDAGTGVFGDTGSPIFARSGKAMHFEVDGREIFARMVMGQHGQHFFAATEAFAQALLRMDPHIRLALDEMAAEAAAMAPETLR